jgi:hypothetical protein
MPIEGLPVPDCPCPQTAIIKLVMFQAKLALVFVDSPLEVDFAMVNG